MAYFSYKARTFDGKTVKGLVEAPGAQAAVRLLREKKMFVLGLSETRGKIDIAQTLGLFKRISENDIVNFTRQLSTMVVAGLSLPDALTILRTQTTNQTMSHMLLDIEHQIVAGGSLAESLSKYPQYFSASYVALVRAGEASGTFDQILIRIADTLEAQHEFRNKVKSAMVYPAIIFFGMIVMVIVMMVVVVPKMSELYKDFNLTLPPTTQFLISLSQFTVQFWWVLLVGSIMGFFLYQWGKKTPLGELIIDTVLLKLPLFGDLRKKTLMVDFTRTLSLLLASGIHILDGMRILQGAVESITFRTAVFEIAQKVEKGFSLGETFSQYAIFPPIVSQMMRVGEETGKLDETLAKLSKYFQSESEHMVKGLTTAIEPIIMVFMGVGVGFLVMAIIMPIFQLTSSFQ